MLKNSKGFGEWCVANGDDIPDVILGIRVQGRPISLGLNKSGTKEKFRTLTPTEVMNMHLVKLDKGAPSVFFSVDLPIAEKCSHIFRGFYCLVPMMIGKYYVTLIFFVHHVEKR